MPSLAQLFAEARRRGVPRYRTLPKRDLEALLGDARAVADGPVRVERDGPLAVIVLDDPETRNALGVAALEALGRICDELATDAAVRLVALTGAGRVFCSGAGIREHDGLPDGGALLTDRGTAALDRLAALPVPTVALVNGPAVGGGAELALAADWRLLAPDGELRFVHAGLGLVPGFGGLGRLAARVGPDRALRLLACRAAVGAETAVALGLADAVVPATALRGRARALADEVAGSDREALALAKRVLAGELAPRDAFLEAWPRRRIPAAARG